MTFCKVFNNSVKGAQSNLRRLWNPFTDFLKNGCILSCLLEFDNKKCGSSISFFGYKCLKLKLKGVFSSSYCFYGNLKCHTVDSSLVTNDGVVFFCYHDFGTSRYRVVTLIHRNPSLGKYWKLLPATLRGANIFCKIYSCFFT